MREHTRRSNNSSKLSLFNLLPSAPPSSLLSVTHRQVQPIQHGNIPRGIPKPHILKLDLDTHVTLPQIPKIKRDELSVIVILASHLNDAVRGDRSLGDIYSSQSKLYNIHENNSLGP